MNPRTLHDRIFLVGAGLIGLHVADDSFIQPQPGTSAGDHLVSGLVPLAALALAVAAYMRLRADGGRAVISLIVGFFGIVGGVEAIHYTRNVGPSGDDFTGLLSIPAGLALIGLGAVMLWRSRRTDDSHARRYSRRALKTVIALPIFVVVLFPIGFAYVVTHAARPPVEKIDLGTSDVEKVTFTTSDGLKLRGSYVASKNGAAVMVVFGRSGSQKQARMLARHGYGVLIFDRRGEGESDGDPNAYGWTEAEYDINAAVDFLKSRPDVEPGRIGGLGLSVGGESLLQAAAHNEDLGAVVSEGASVRSGSELRSVPGGDFMTIASMTTIEVGTAVFSDASPPPHLIDLVGDIAPRPLLLVYATKGTGGEEKQFNPAFARAAGPTASTWEIPEASHVGGLKARPREYEQRVTAFFDNALLDEPIEMAAR